MFKGLSFYAKKRCDGGDVDDHVLRVIEDESGTIVPEILPSSPRSIIYLVNHDTETNDYDGPVVIQGYITVCEYRMKRVDIDPFTLRLEGHRKRGKADPYTQEEDDVLRGFAREFEDLTQQNMWEKAERRKLVYGRTAGSMMRRYSKIKSSTMDRTNKHYSKYDEKSILRWWFLWKTKKHPKGDIWEVAKENRVVPNRSASQLKSKFYEIRTSKQHNRGEEELMKVAKEIELYSGDWDYFND